ncbi:hypothetical protein K435DRAFT_802993 [Dendrothele bispora CBS 962.96]|uniref:Uncharacterized protein n=1 Tax=Dendrothele bispora (strain CBS 962.96) TaxID=1314807 RepID=A0A4S8LIY7_DENBC|nr:hypothetical protein K435DRAFT_802993 [Dendrothele bispora CBS 962.96]
MSGSYVPVPRPSFSLLILSVERKPVCGLVVATLDNGQRWFLRITRLCGEREDEFGMKKTKPWHRRGLVHSIYRRGQTALSGRTSSTTKIVIRLRTYTQNKNITHLPELDLDFRTHWPLTGLAARQRLTNDRGKPFHTSALIPSDKGPIIFVTGSVIRLQCSPRQTLCINAEPFCVGELMYTAKDISRSSRSCRADQMIERFKKDAGT